MNHNKTVFDLPNVTIYPSLEFQSNESVDYMCPLQSWGSITIPMTVVLSPKSLNLFSYSSALGKLKIQEFSEVYYFENITKYPGIICTHLNSDPFLTNNIFIDCYT